MKARGRKTRDGLLIGAASAALALGLSATGGLTGAENLAWTIRVKALARPSVFTSDITLILLDQASLDWGESVSGWEWPWPREIQAAIIEFCSDAGARAIVADVIYSESSVHDVYQDQILADAIDRAENVATTIALSRSSGATTHWPDDVPRPPEIGGLASWMQDAGDLEAAYATFPVPEVAGMSAALGNIMAAEDDQAEITRMPVFRIFDGQAVPTLGLAAYLAAYPEVQPSIRGDRLHVGRPSLPLDDGARTILRYRGPGSVYPSYSAASVLQSQIRILEGRDPTLDPALFKDAWVFFGFSAPALMDLRPTPLSPVAPGVSLHANLLDNLLAGDAIREITPIGGILGVVLPALLAGILIRFCTGGAHSAAVILLLVPAPLVGGFAGYGLGVWVPVAAPTLAVLVALMGGVTMNYAVEGRARAFLKNAFQHYLSPAVIDQILADPERLQLGGERRELTILFSDLQGFSAIAEALDPQALIDLLNDYLSDMTSIILEEDGTLDKYEGDAIIAFWNAPLDQPDHPARACRAAVRCQQRLAERREEFRQRCGHALHMRIGVHTGPVVVGNMGSHDRFDYTVLGDAANLASRLEGANKIFGTYTLVSEATWSSAGSAAIGRPLGYIRVVGRSQPVSVFELNPAPPAAFLAALRLFESGELAAAETQFAALPEDPASVAYHARCRSESVEDEDWDPTWNLTAK